MRFDRSSDSMATNDSGKLPTLQADSVGNIPLVAKVGKSDKSDMPTADQVRQTIRRALDERAKPLGPIEVIAEMKKTKRYRDWDRVYLSDFLKEKPKKQSLDQEFREDLADFLGIDAELLRITKPRKLPEAIRGGTAPRLYVSEHMEDRGLDDKRMSDRIDGVDAATVARWRSDPSKLLDWQVRAILHALNIDDVAVLAHPPRQATKRTKSSHPTRRRA
jgi:hypothetical protein